jgi:predicted MFS family arabinose efflux permease
VGSGARTTGRRSPETGRPPRLVATIAISLAIMTSSMFWPFAFGVLAPVILDEFDLTAGAFGVTYAIYYLSATIGSTWVGRGVDALTYRSSVQLMALGSFVQLALFATATSIVGLVASAVVGGVVMATANPLTNSLIASSLIAREVRIAVGFKMGGVPLAAIASGAILPAIAGASTWRMAIVACAVLPAMVMVASSRLSGGGRSVPDRAAPGGAPRGRRRIGWTGLELYALLLGMVTAGINGYLPLFTVDELSGSLARGGALLSTFALAGALGRLFWSIVARGARQILLVLAGLPAVGGVALMGVSVFRSDVAVWPLVILCGLTLMAWQGVGMLAIIAQAQGAVGRTSARVFQYFYGGFVVGAPVMGYLVDRHGYLVGWFTLSAAALLGASSLVPRLRSRSRERGDEPVTV